MYDVVLRGKEGQKCSEGVASLWATTRRFDMLVGKNKVAVHMLGVSCARQGVGKSKLTLSDNGRVVVAESSALQEQAGQLLFFCLYCSCSTGEVYKASMIFELVMLTKIGVVCGAQIAC